MELGPIQREILNVIDRSPGGACIRAGVVYPELAGRSMEEVEASLERLVARKIIYKEGVRWKRK